MKRDESSFEAVTDRMVRASYCQDFHRPAMTLKIQRTCIETFTMKASAPFEEKPPPKKEMHRDYLDSHFHIGLLLHVCCAFARPSNSPLVHHRDAIDSRKHTLCFYRDLRVPAPTQRFLQS